MPEHGSKTSTVPVVWATLEFVQRDPNVFLSRLVTVDGTWLYHYDPETTQRSMERQHSGSLRPPQKIPSAKMRWKSSRLDFLGTRQHPPQWLSFKGPNYQHGVLLISAGATEGHWRKNAAGRSPRGLVLARQCPGSPGTCNPEETGLPGLPVFTLRIWPRRTTTCFQDWKKQLKGRHFSSDAEVIAAAETWLDGQASELFFWVACKSSSHWLRSVLSFVGSNFNKSRVWSL